MDIVWHVYTTMTIDSLYHSFTITKTHFTVLYIILYASPLFLTTSKQ